MTFIPLRDLKGDLDTMNSYLAMIADLAQARGVAADIRTTVLGGNINVTGSLASVTNLSQVGGYAANTQVFDTQNIAATLGNVDNFTP